MTNTTVPDDLAQRVLSVDEAGRVLGVGRSTMYGAIRRGQVPALRIGRRIVVPGAALVRLLETATPLEPFGSTEAG
jgi:excisionase family DNA binding protein